MKWFCRHDWTQWSQQVMTNQGVNQFRFCKKCNIVKQKNFKLNMSYLSIHHNLNIWNNPKSEADKLKSEVSGE